MIEQATQTRDAISFGPFSLVASERLLTKEGAPVELGARTLDLLIALVARPNEVVSKRDLLAWVWPDVTVEEGSLRFHVASLRKALGDGKGGARYIATMAGRGYCFVAPISARAIEPMIPMEVAASFPHANLPSRLIRMVGRTHDALSFQTQLAAARFVTIVGSGGVGKTTVAVAVGHDLIESFAGAVLFVDLGALSDPSLVATAIASMLGLSVQSERYDAQPDRLPAGQANPLDPRYLRTSHRGGGRSGVAHLRSRAASSTSWPPAARRFGSRASMSTDWRRSPVRLMIRTSPRQSAKDFPATQLFLERAAASGARLDLSDADAAIVASICRKLDGVALAIELAAGRVEAYGLPQTAALLDQRLTLLWPGQRTAPPRQKTLQATLDWSYGLLSELERSVLRRLAVFVGPFTHRGSAGSRDQHEYRSRRRFQRHRQPRCQVDGRGPPRWGHDALSAVGHDARLRSRNERRRGRGRRPGRSPRKLLSAMAGAHRDRVADPVDRRRNGRPSLPVSAMSALLWNGALAPTAMLTSASISPPPRHQSSWRCPCSPNVIAGRSARFSRSTMTLARARGDASAGGARIVVDVHARHERSGARRLEQGPGDRRGTWRRPQSAAAARPTAYVPLPHRRFQAALDYAKRSSSVAATVGDPTLSRLAHSLLGISLHLTGDLGAARAELEAALQHGPGPERTSMIYLGFDTIAGRGPWRERCGCKAIRRRPWNVRARPSRMPQASTIR